MNRRECIIISSESDYHSCAVRYAIRSAGGMCEILDTAKFMHKVRPEAYISISNVGLNLGGVTLASNYKSIWARRMLKTKDFDGIPRKYAGYVGSESAEFERNILKILDSENKSRWVNRISSVGSSEVKSYQLSMASRCGLKVPDTLITASPNLIREFCGRYDFVVIKPFSPHSWLDNSINKQWMTFANKIKYSEIAACKDVDLSAAPCIYQEYVPTVADIRVGVIGERVFALEMRHKTVGKIDFRTMGDDELAYSQCSVPQNISRGLQRLMHELDVTVASADFVLDKDGQWHFIELNPSGAFLFLEDRCPDIKILSAMASLLFYGAVEDGCDLKFPSLASFKESPDHAKWMDEWKGFSSANKYRGNITYLDEI